VITRIHCGTTVNERLSIKPDPAISVFYKATKNSPTQVVEPRFSRDAAMIFCDRIRHDLMDNNSKSFTITGGDLIGLKEVLDWVKECVDAQSITKYKEVYLSASHPQIPCINPFPF
jgi:hypothetical protein